jgi:hypothetical protein
MSEAILFDRDRVDHLESLSDVPRRLGDSTLLWVDLQHRGSSIGVDEVADAFELDDRTREYLAAPPESAVFDDCGRYLHITTYGPREEVEGELPRGRS